MVPLPASKHRVIETIVAAEVFIVTVIEKKPCTGQDESVRMRFYRAASFVDAAHSKDCSFRISHL